MLEENLLSTESSQSPKEELVQQEEIIAQERGSFEGTGKALAGYCQLKIAGEKLSTISCDIKSD